MSKQISLADFIKRRKIDECQTKSTSLAAGISATENPTEKGQVQMNSKDMGQNVTDIEYFICCYCFNIRNTRFLRLSIYIYLMCQKLSPKIKFNYGTTT